MKKNVFRPFQILLNQSTEELFSLAGMNDFLSSIESDAIIIKFLSPCILCSQQHQVGLIPIQLQLVVAHELRDDTVLLCELGRDGGHAGA